MMDARDRLLIRRHPPTKARPAVDHAQSRLFLPMDKVATGAPLPFPPAEEYVPAEPGSDEEDDRCSDTSA
jgi:hypothetical protein